MKKLKLYLYQIFLFSASFFFARWFFMNYLYAYSLTFFRNGSQVDFWIPFIQILIITIFSYLFLQSFFSKVIPRWSVKLFYFLYFLLLIFVLFFKNIGIRGIELNPFSFTKDFVSGDSLVVLLNILMFIPLGWLVKFNKKSLFLFILLIFFVECIQLILSLGIFDMGDIVMNTVGFTAGAYIRESRIGKRVVTYVR